MADGPPIAQVERVIDAGDPGSRSIVASKKIVSSVSTNRSVERSFRPAIRSR